MNIKKILASVAAAALAVSSMALTAFATMPDTTNWAVAAYATRADGSSKYNGVADWNNVLEPTLKVADIMEAEGIEDINDLGMIVLQVWNAAIGDSITFDVTVYSGDTLVNAWKGGRVFEAPSWDPESENADTTFLQIKGSDLTEDCIIYAIVTPFDNGEEEGEGTEPGEGEGDGDSEGEVTDSADVTAPAESTTVNSEDGTVTVTGNLPAEVTAVKVELVETEDGTVAYNITLVDANGEVVPLDGETEVTVTIKVPEELADAENLYVYYQNDEGKIVEKMDAAVEDGVITFKTTHFSTYVISAEEIEIPLESGNENGDLDNKTEDKTEPVNTGAVLMVIPAVVAAAGVIVSRKRK